MLTTTTSELPQSVAEPTIYSSLIAQVDFHLIFNPIYNRLINHSRITGSETLQFDAQVSDWLQSLPNYFQEQSRPEFSFHWLIPARYRLSWRVRSLRILIFFPIFLRWVVDDNGENWANATEEDRVSLSTCLDYAHQNVSSIEGYFLSEPSNVMGDWYAL